MHPSYSRDQSQSVSRRYSGWPNYGSSPPQDPLDSGTYERRAVPGNPLDDRREHVLAPFPDVAGDVPDAELIRDLQQRPVVCDRHACGRTRRRYRCAARSGEWSLDRPLAGQAYEARRSGPEASRRVERGQFRIVIDVQPFGAAGRRLLSRGPDEGKPEAATPMGGMHGRVEQEGMKAAVPGHIDEAYELASVSRPAPGEAPSEHGPEGSWLVARPGCREQSVQLCIREYRADLDGDVLHGVSRIGSSTDPYPPLSRLTIKPSGPACRDSP